VAGAPLNGRTESARGEARPVLETPAAWVYLLRCADGSLYTGWTTDVRRRLAQHQAGTASRYTRPRRPVALALSLPMVDRGAARREEARIKRLSRAEKVRLIGEGAALADRTGRPV